MEKTKKYEMGYDLHTHTIYSHGTGSIEDNVKAAIAKGMSHIAISDHGPGHRFYGIKREDVPKMREEIEALNRKYPQIQIRLSVEANIVKNGNHLDVTPEEYDQYDFVIAGYHYGIPGCYSISNLSLIHI